jgi:hypothetical protein
MVCGWQSVAERRWGEWGDRLIISIETIHGCVLNGSSKIVKLQTGAKRSAIRRGSAATKSLDAIANGTPGHQYFGERLFSWLDANRYGWL